MLNFDLIGYIKSQIQASTFGVVRQGKLNLNPPGGFDGQLIQSAVAYDSAEASYSGGSTSLLDNLAHLRFLIGTGGGTLTSVKTYNEGFPVSGPPVGQFEAYNFESGSFVVISAGSLGNITINPILYLDEVHVSREFTVGTTGVYGGGSYGGGVGGDGSLYGAGSAGNYIATIYGRLDMYADRFRLRQSFTPSSGSSGGSQGEIAYDSNFLYVAVGPNHWKRAALSDF